ncbi:hypothetical protein BD289DRAFT_161186 [Coniella lustricola]|uniref:Uncharacterized protein n=1 Tax=Coniella lustricola TaxID=2025994 RepID=A0A2T2ZUJ5_9PEZI|nr:hypothetical protein BD289DRAFT_161186 [Coniella lustricola]
MIVVERGRSMPCVPVAVLVLSCLALAWSSVNLLKMEHIDRAMRLRCNQRAVCIVIVAVVMVMLPVKQSVSRGSQRGEATRPNANRKLYLASLNQTPKDWRDINRRACGWTGSLAFHLSFPQCNVPWLSSRIGAGNCKSGRIVRW